MNKPTCGILDSARAALASEPLVAPHVGHLSLSFADGTLTLEGEVKSVAAKKLALECAAALPEVTGIVDRLHVEPAQHMGDGQIRDLLRDALVQEPAFSEFAIGELIKGQLALVREPATVRRGSIEIDVSDGIVTLNGEVPGLAYKRLAGVLSWWVPGSRDVINGLDEVPSESDSDDEISDAVRLALEKDPFVNAGQIHVSTRARVVTLIGLVPSESEREMAEADAWYVLGVDNVINKVAVRA